MFIIPIPLPRATNLKPVDKIEQVFENNSTGLELVQLKSAVHWGRCLIHLNNLSGSIKLPNCCHSNYTFEKTNPA